MAHGDKAVQERIFAAIRRCNADTGCLRVGQVITGALRHAALHGQGPGTLTYTTEDAFLLEALEAHALYLETCTVAQTETPVVCRGGDPQGQD